MTCFNCCVDMVPARNKPLMAEFGRVAQIQLRYRSVLTNKIEITLDVPYIDPTKYRAYWAHFELDRSVSLLCVKSNVHYARVITPSRVSVRSGGAHLRGKAHGQHSSEETSQLWRVVDDAVSDLIDPGIEPQTAHTYSNVLTTHVGNITLLSAFLA